jgi:hypothetical protein
MVTSQTDILIGADNGAAAKIEPAGLKVRVQVRLKRCVSDCATVSIANIGVLTCDKLWVRRGIDLTSEAASCAYVQATHAASSKERPRCKERRTIVLAVRKKGLKGMW